MNTITFLNQKGGVGKTSCVYHLAGALGAWETILAAYTDFGAGDHDCLEVARATGIAGIDLIAGSPDLVEHDEPRPEERLEEDQRSLESFLAAGAVKYDLVLIDCPPNLLGLSWRALAASDGLVIPLQPEDFGAQGIVAVQAFLGRSRRRVNPGLALLGYLITMHEPRTVVHRLYEEQLRAAYGAEVFAASVPRATDFAKAILMRTPVGMHNARSRAAAAIDVVAAEIEARMKAAMDAIPWTNDEEGRDHA